jgi:1-aminocyclopropane-1-carboxylate synthase
VSAFNHASTHVHKCPDGFDEDMTVRSGAVVVAVDVGPDYASPGTLDAFEHQLSLSVQEGIKPAAVMLTNPNNPLGFNYPRETIIAYARFCEKHNLHLVVDEIYALSQFENDEVEEKDRVPFTSILAIDVLKEAGCNPARVHVLYGVAKDFGANGFRIGWALFFIIYYTSSDVT